MTLGTSIGGYKIIKTVGLKMVKLEPYQGTAADLVGSFCLLFCHLRLPSKLRIVAPCFTSPKDWERIIENLVC
jgi:hypothetical protein